jgi:hypothetical protein
VDRFRSVIVWSDAAAHTSEMFFTINTRGSIRELKSHREVTLSQFVEAVSFSLFIGRAVTFEVCDESFHVVQRADFQRPPVTNN